MILAYEAIDSSGALVRDQLVADDRGQAFYELQRRGLVPVHLTEQDPDEHVANDFLQRLLPNRQRHASRKELPFFTEQLSILLETGTPVAASLEAIERQVTCPRWRSLVARLNQAVEEGSTLASAVQEYDHVFDPVYSSMIAAGEASGCLADIMKRLAAIARQTQRVRKKVIAAMIYPALLTSIAFSVMLVLIFFVLPRFSNVFTEMGVDLPSSTRTLLAISGFVRGNLILVAGLVGALVIGIVYWVKSQPGRRFIATATLRAPIMGPLVRSLTNARIFRILGLLVQSQVPLLDALDLTRAGTKNHLYGDLIARMHENVLNGRPMYDALRNSTLIPASLAQMVRTGEENAQIGHVLTLLADHLDDANETQIATLTSIMEPVILIVMGGVIGSVAMSLVLPMFDLSRISSG